MSLLIGEISEMQTDPVVEYLTKLLDEACFEVQEDGTMWCSDSNGSIDPHEAATKIREILGVPYVRS